MVLTKDVRDRRGRLLLSAGQEVTSQALRVFRMWGVTELDVNGPERGPDSTPAAPPDPERVAAAAAEAERLFRHANRAHPVVAELFRLVAVQRAVRPCRARHAR
jgi:hypothetical protein